VYNFHHKTDGYNVFLRQNDKRKCKGSGKNERGRLEFFQPGPVVPGAMGNLSPETPVPEPVWGAFIAVFSPVLLFFAKICN
jgi:hypothetical protein